MPLGHSCFRGRWCRLAVRWRGSAMIETRRAILVAVLLTALPFDSFAADLTIMAEDAAQPFSRPDGTGYANDVVKAAFHAAGVEVVLDVVPYARCKKNAEEGRIAACFGMSWYQGVEKVVAFSSLPIFEVHADVFLNRKAPARIARLGEIKTGAVIGIVNEYEYPDGIYELRSRGVVFQPAPNDGA